MQRQHTQLTGLLGAILLTAGLASSITLADETPSEPKQQTQTKEEGLSSTKAAPGAEAKEDEQPEMVEVRISLPSGRTITRMEPVRKISARRDMDFQVNISRTLSDGSRISVAGQGVSGGSNSSSIRVGGSPSGGGGGGGGSSAHGGGGGGGSSSGVTSYSKPTITAKGLDTDGVIEGAQLQGGTEETASAAQSGSSSSSGASGSGSHGGVFQVTNNTSNYAVQGSGSSNTGSNASNSGSNSGSGSGGDSANAGDSDQAPSTPSIPTVGNADYDDEGATGGQTVEFSNAGMSAAVIGNMVYFNGVEFVRSDQPFTVVTGTRVGSDSVIMDDQRPSNAGAHDLSDFTTNSCPIRIEFDSDTVVNLVMQSQSSNPASPSRVERTWTVRVR